MFMHSVEGNDLPSAVAPGSSNLRYVTNHFCSLMMMMMMMMMMMIFVFVFRG